MEYEKHDFCGDLPAHTASEFDALCANIEAVGQQEPITLFMGQVLDGWHRLQACKKLGIEPKFTTFDGTRTRAFYFVQGKIHGRQWTRDKWTLQAARFALRKESDPELSSDRKFGIGTTIREEAATAHGIGLRTLEKAIRVIKHGGEIHERVKRGDLSIDQANILISKLESQKSSKPIQAAPKAKHSERKHTKSKSKPAIMARQVPNNWSEERNLLRNVWDNVNKDYFNVWEGIDRLEANDRKKLVVDVLGNWEGDIRTARGAVSGLGDEMG
jgi:hypothetical protein